MLDNEVGLVARLVTMRCISAHQSFRAGDGQDYQPCAQSVHARIASQRPLPINSSCCYLRLQ